jgi:hypothetical protein
MVDGITREYRHETHLTKKLLSSSQGNIGSSIPRTLASGAYHRFLFASYTSRTTWSGRLASVNPHKYLDRGLFQPTLMTGHFPIFRTLLNWQQAWENRSNHVLTKSFQTICATEMTTNEPFAEIEIFPRRRPKSLSHYRSAQQIPDDFCNLLVHNIQPLRNLLRPTLADHLTWYPLMLVSVTQRRRERTAFRTPKPRALVPAASTESYHHNYC